MPMVNDRSRRLENRAVTQAKSPMQYETQIRLLEKQVDKEKARAVNATIQAKASEALQRQVLGLKQRVQRRDGQIGIMQTEINNQGRQNRELHA